MSSRAFAETLARRRGAGLAEGLMAIVVSMLVLSVVPAFYRTSIELWQRETGRLGAVEKADLLLMRMQDDIRNARRANLSSDGRAMTVVLPARTYDTSLSHEVNVLDASGSLVDGNQIQYYFVLDPQGTGSQGGAIYRRLVRPDGTQGLARLVADRVYPQLNPRGSGTSSPAPLFVYNATLRTVTVTITTAEPKPSNSGFAVRNPEPRCGRCGGALVRVPTTEHLEGEIQCSNCGGAVEPTSEIVTYQTQLMVRNQ